MFHYAAAKGNWPYGTGISLWRDGASRPAWVYFHDGDFPPHTLVWQDLTGDRIPDLFFLAGEEDEFASTALEWRESGEAGGDPLLVPIYSDSDSYAMLADLDSDGLPELIDSGNAKDDEADGCESLVFPPEVAERAEEEYARIAGQYAEVNFNSGTANHAVWTLHLLQPVRIISLKGGLRTEVTRRFGTHLGIRIKILETVRQAASPECRRTLDALVGYLKSEMGNSR